MKQKFRIYPRPGEVVAVPLPNNIWVYMCFAANRQCYLYEFKSRGAAPEDLNFSKSHWMALIGFPSQVPMSWRTVSKVSISAEDTDPWLIVKNKRGDTIDCYVASNGFESRPATESEVENSRGYFKTFWDVFERDIAHFVVNMEAVHGEACLSKHNAPENTDVQFEIINLDEEFYYTLPDDIAQEADKSGIYLDWISSEPVYSSRRSEVAKALKLIRREIKKVVPKDQWDDIEIVVSGQSDDDIQHFPVEAKRKK